ncbi:MAG: hypothetical protein H6698_05920 [Myxococcales bacterium]|nr:hypothetical protein [Myxococcales bacterium]MCB9533842.1 hypothetical protein [Myxococcales bacterium]
MAPRHWIAASAAAEPTAGTLWLGPDDTARNGWLWAVVAGHGPRAAARVAAAMCIHTILERYADWVDESGDPLGAVDSALDEAHARLRAVGEVYPALRGMAASVGVLAFDGERLAAGTVGDAAILSSDGALARRLTPPRDVDGVPARAVGVADHRLERIAEPLSELHTYVLATGELCRSLDVDLVANLVERLEPRDAIELALELATERGGRDAAAAVVRLTAAEGLLSPREQVARWARSGATSWPEQTMLLQIRPKEPPVPERTNFPTLPTIDAETRHTPDEIGKTLGLSPDQVRQIVAASQAKAEAGGEPETSATAAAHATLDRPGGGETEAPAAAAHDARATLHGASASAVVQGEPDRGAAASAAASAGPGRPDRPAPKTERLEPSQWAASPAGTVQLNVAAVLAREAQLAAGDGGQGGAAPVPAREALPEWPTMANLPAIGFDVRTLDAHRAAVAEPPSAAAALEVLAGDEAVPTAAEPSPEPSIAPRSDVDLVADDSDAPPPPPPAEAPPAEASSAEPPPAKEPPSAPPPEAVTEREGYAAAPPPEPVSDPSPAGTPPPASSSASESDHGGTMVMVALPPPPTADVQPQMAFDPTMAMPALVVPSQPAPEPSPMPPPVADEAQNPSSEPAKSAPVSAPITQTETPAIEGFGAPRSTASGAPERTLLFSADAISAAVRAAEATPRALASVASHGTSPSTPVSHEPPPAPTRDLPEVDTSRRPTPDASQDVISTVSMSGLETPTPRGKWAATIFAALLVVVVVVWWVSRGG